MIFYYATAPHHIALYHIITVIGVPPRHTRIETPWGSRQLLKPGRVSRWNQEVAERQEALAPEQPAGLDNYQHPFEVYVDIDTNICRYRYKYM